MLVLYIILFIASIFFYILYVGSFSFYLFAFLLVMPIILFFMLKKMSKKISVGFVNTQKTAGRSSKIPVVLRLQNRSKLPVANMIIEIEYYNTLDGDKNTMKINTPLYPDDVQYLTLHVSAKHYGTVRMNIKRCRIVDMLKLFKIRVSIIIAIDIIDCQKRQIEEVLAIVKHQSLLLGSLQEIIDITFFTKNRQTVEMQRRHIFF